jgi:transcription initiation factor TFIID TATA-box-binding protein
LTPPSSEKEGNATNGGSGANGNVNNGQQHGGNAMTSGNGVTPTTPAATPAGAGGQNVSGIVPTLQ